MTGKQKTKSAGTPNEDKAIKEAGKWEDELRTGRYEAPSRLAWKTFRKKYETERLSGLAETTQRAAGTALNHLERILNPDRLAKLTTANLSRFQSKLREEGMKDTTLAAHVRNLRPALTWAVSLGLLPKMPNFHPPKRAKGQTLMRGRPITEEEFDRMIAAAPKVRPHDALAWVRYLTGLWLSGLRLKESLALSWEQDAPFYADLTGRRPSFRIYAEAQKSGRDEVLPMTPDFAQFLLQTPRPERAGKVFELDGLLTGKPISPKRVCRLISKFGKKTGVVVNKADGKFASAHDFRRAFGTRWSKRVMPAVLRRLMRHSSIDTTMGYYVDIDSDDVADQLWAGWGNTPAQGNILGNIDQNGAKKPETAPAREATEAVDN